MDLKPAFDSVDKGGIIRAMREREVREESVISVEEMLKETKSRVRVGEKKGKNCGQLRK